MEKLKKKHRVAGREMGQLRIYLTARVKGRKPKGWTKIFGGRPLYMEMIAAAKDAGILHAAAHHSHHGYNGSQSIQSDIAEAPNTNLTMYIELIDERAKLEAFCRTHAELLKGRTMVFKHVEHWDIHDDTLEEIDASVAELESLADED